MSAVCCRALTDDEVETIIKSLTSLRNKAFFILGIRTGFRVSELCQIKVKDVMQHGKVSSSVTVAKRFMKGQIESREVALHAQAREIIGELIQKNGLRLDSYLFQSREGGLGLTPGMVRKFLKSAYAKMKLEGPLSTHSMRKTFATRFYYASGKDLYLTQKALGHKSVDSTAKYLSVKNEYLENLILNMP